jgi:hypothetical protein
MSVLTWTVGDSGGHYADFGRGRYSVARTHGRVPRLWRAGTAAVVHLLRARTSRARRR